MKLGVVGLPNVGKSTLFNAITQAGAECANYPFCTIEPNVGTVAVPDERLYKLAALYNCKKIVHTTIEFVDIAGLVRGASKGEGLGNKFLSHIREVDAVVHVVRCFEDDNITHVDGTVDPVRDINTIDLELILSDLELISRRLDRAKSMKKTGDKKYAAEADLLQRISDGLEREIPVRSMEFTEEEAEFVKSLFLLTSKPVIYAANISEGDIARAEELPHVRAVREFAARENAQVITLCARIEEELTKLPEEERAMFLEELGIRVSGLSQLVTACYTLLGLVSFLTAGEKETRAWTVERGTKAPGAAGRIHSDFEKGFIRAEVVDCDVLLACGSFNAAKERGRVRSEGKDYVVKDGDVVLFRFNV